MKKKFYGVSPTLTKGIRDTLNAVENNLDNFRFCIVQLNQIEVDPENPRDLQITLDDIKKGLSENDPNFTHKKSEYNALVTLAHTINMKGLINPIVLYKHHEMYRLVAGERRFLASHISQKVDIQARILSEKPTMFDLRLLQWIENNEREGLTLKERISNIRSIVEAYKIQYGVNLVTAEIIQKTTGLSQPQAWGYYQVLIGPQDVLSAIESNQIKNLDKAALIAGIKNDEIRGDAISLCAKGLALKELKKFCDTKLLTNPTNQRKKGRKASRVNLGSTSNLEAIKKLILSVTQLPEFQHYNSSFSTVQWSSYSDVTRAFKEFLRIIESYK